MAIEKKRRFGRTIEHRHQVIVRYSIELGRWIHSSGVVMNPNESAVMSYLGQAYRNHEIAKAACISESHVEKILIDLRKRFNVPGAKALGRSQLMNIAMDLFP